jgi:deoxyribonuclease V
MDPVLEHDWDLAPCEAIALQRDLALRVEQQTIVDLRRLRLIVGVDVAYSAHTGRCFGGAVVWDHRAQRVEETATASRPLRFPYVPGLLSFREIPVLVAALRQLEREPELIVAEGHGLAHPRGFGLASHLGVLYDRPAVGCAKSVLVGEHGPLPAERGAHEPLRHEGQTVGSVLRTRDGVRPVVVSVGHGVNLGQARRVVLATARSYRMPEPLRRAHQLAGALRRRPER